jgi:hypothetical protein
MKCISQYSKQRLNADYFSKNSIVLNEAFALHSTDNRRQTGKLFFTLLTVVGRPKKYFLLSRRPSADRKIIFYPPDDRRQTRKLFSTLPTAVDRPENYFLLFRQSSNGQHSCIPVAGCRMNHFSPLVLFRKYFFIT